MISSVHKAAPTRTLNPTIAVLVQSTARVLSIDISFWPPSYSIKEDKGRVRETEGFRLILKSLHDEMKKQAEMNRLVAEDSLLPKRSQVWTQQKLKKAVSITAFLSEKETMCTATKTDFVGVFGFNPKSGQVQVSLAKSLYQETIEYLREIAVKDVSMYLVVTVHVVSDNKIPIFQFR